MTGIRVLSNGRYQAFVKVRGRFRSRCFPKTTALAVMKAWREEQRVRARLGAELPEAGDVPETDSDDADVPAPRRRSGPMAARPRP